MRNADFLLERRCRYRLGLHGLRLHKLRDKDTYYVTEASNDERPDPDDPYSWQPLGKVEEYCEELEQKDAEYYAERRAEMRERR